MRGMEIKGKFNRPGESREAKPAFPSFFVARVEKIRKKRHPIPQKMKRRAARRGHT